MAKRVSFAAVVLLLLPSCEPTGSSNQASARSGASASAPVLQSGEALVRVPGPPPTEQHRGVVYAHRDYACTAGPDAEARARALNAEYSKSTNISAAAVSRGAREALGPRVAELEAAQRTLQCRLISTQPYETRSYRYANANLPGQDIYVECAFQGSEAETKARADRASALLNAPPPPFDPQRPFSEAVIRERVAEQTRTLRESYACARRFGPPS